MSLPLTIVALALVAHAVGAADRQSRTVPLPAGRTLSVDITIGQVRIDGSAGDDATIEIERHAPTAAALAGIPVVIEETDTEVRVRATQSDGATDPALRTDVTIRVPARAEVRPIQIVEGALRVTGVHGAITADIRRGSITATDLQGEVRLETGIGDIDAGGMRLSPDGLLRLRAFNGDVRLTLASPPVDARILALALNGTIDSQIPLRTRDTWGPRWGEATLGRGEPVISIDVITGQIVIRVAAPAAP